MRRIVTKGSRITLCHNADYPLTADIHWYRLFLLHNHTKEVLCGIGECGKGDDNSSEDNHGCQEPVILNPGNDPVKTHLLFLSDVLLISLNSSYCLKKWITCWYEELRVKDPCYEPSVSQLVVGTAEPFLHVPGQSKFG